MTPFICLHIIFRVLRGRENPKRYTEKMSCFNLLRPQGKLLWFHAASVGEINSIIPLIKYLQLGHHELSFLITTITLSSEKVFLKSNLKHTIHQFLPIDQHLLVRKFLNHWEPDLGIFVDSEIWPNLLVEAAKKTPLININARLSNKSFQRWQNIPSLLTFLYDKFNMILPSSVSEQEKIMHFANVKKIKYIGNLKYSMPNLTCDKGELASMLEAIGNRPVWIAASTHCGEEEIVLKVHQKLLQNFPDLMLIIAPRHPERGEEIVKLALSHKLAVAQRFASQNITSVTQVYIADTLAELGLIYRLSKIVLVGGSLIDLGKVRGHNFLEASRLGCMVIVGPNTENFKDLTSEFLALNALVVVENEAMLLNNMTKLLNNPHTKDQYIKNGNQFSSAAAEIMKDAAQIVLSQIKPK